MDADDRQKLPTYNEVKCNICGMSRIEHKEWHQCPKEQALVCSVCHAKCKYKSDFHMCKYRPTEGEKIFNGAELRLQINNKKKFADKLYKQGKWRVADEIYLEISKLEKKLRE